MTKRITYLGCLLVLTMLNSMAQPYTLLEKQKFNDGWKFHRNEFINADAFDFDDSDWEEVNLPHDWAITGPFAEEFDPRCGGLPFFSTGWYRKHFSLPPEFQGKRINIQFDGAMKNARVWLNGKFIGERPYGYSSFSFEISSSLNFGDEENVVTVRLQPEDLSSRWYSGAGLYRNVWLEINNPIHIKQWGTYITTPTIEEERARVNVQTTLWNAFDANKNVRIEYTILDTAAVEIAKHSSQHEVISSNDNTINQSINIKNPSRWDIEDPYLYTLETRIYHNKELVDKEVTQFGIRTIDFIAGEGFFLNGRLVRFNGVCLHHDLGPLGAAVNDRAVERQLQIMQSMGVNAIRTSHNPPSPEVLKYCNRLGLLVINEAFDCWEMSKVPNDYGTDFKEWYDKDLRDMIRRDRNHPSVIMWSIGNEILEQGTKKRGKELTRHLSDICHEEDDSRPTTAGFNYFEASIANGLADEVDVVGFNYFPAQYANVIRDHPEWIIYGSETASTVSSRGVYHFPIEKYDKHPSHQLTGYDIIGPPWQCPPDIEFHHQEEAPSCLGEFLWTGFDYLGEPTPYGGKDNKTHGRWMGDWPSRSSYFGAVDLCGFPKDRYYLYQSQWTKEPMIHLLPHWNWEFNIGDTIPVYCYTNCDEAELFVNGVSVGKKIKGVDLTPVFVDYYFNEFGNVFMSKYRLNWEVPYKAGSIKVIGYKAGKAVVEKEIKTAGKPSQIKLIPDRKIITADGTDLSFITVRIEDDSGNLCPTANNLIHFDISGTGQLAAVGNGNPATTQLFTEPYRNAFNGLCLLIVKSEEGRAGTIKIKAKAESMKITELTIESQL